MSATVVVGAQWGDEGKGKVTDLLARDVDFVARYQGGNNAGHTIVVGGDRFALHLLPSGVLTPGVVPVIGNGVVVEPLALLREIEELEGRGIDTSRLLISQNAHVVTAEHVRQDAEGERALGADAIGTTGRGIGPAYRDKVARCGLRMVDTLSPGEAVERLEESGELSPEQRAAYRSAFERLARHVADTSLALNEALDAGKRVLLEGGQGTMLDVDHGTYPFVTSSNPTAGGAATGVGIGPTRISRVVGVSKAYVTRVGAGPFPTEDFSEAGVRLREAGQEYGVTTGRARRIGWFDVPLARYAARVNGFTDVFLTRLDTLAGVDRVPVCVAYDIDGVRTSELPMDHGALSRAVPVFEYVDGWDASVSQVREWGRLPAAAAEYVRFLEGLCGTRVSGVGVGQGRDAVVEAPH